MPADDHSAVELLVLCGLATGRGDRQAPVRHAGQPPRSRDVLPPQAQRLARPQVAVEPQQQRGRGEAGVEGAVA
eukprot:7268821-Lingulodinium_polyedra.AAC.1